MCGEALTPLTNGMAVTVQFVSDLLVGRSILVGGAEDEATSKGQSLGRGTGSEEGFELLTYLRGEYQA